ncbi:MAG: N-acetyltransferase family protein [Rhizobiaceae bacterium]
MLLPEDVDAESEIEEYIAVSPPNQITLVAEYAGGAETVLVGFVEVGTRDYAEGCETSPVAYIEALYVDVGYRHAGVGRKLVEAAETWARSQGLRELASDVRWDNRLSHAAHLAYGFTETERIICFQKRL